VTLRARLVLGMAVIAAVLVAAGLFVSRTIEGHLVDQVDARLRATGPVVFVAARDSATGLVTTDCQGDDRPSPLFAALLQNDGSLCVLAVPNLSGTPAPYPDVNVEQIAAATESGEPFTIDAVGGGQRYRAMARIDQPFGVVGVIALPLDDVDDAVSKLVLVEVIATFVVLAVLALVTWWVMRLGVRPLKRMTVAAAEIARGDLSVRVPEESARTEAGQLGSALNAMLGHIEAAFDERTRSEERLRQFVADASHELRTPVTTIRGYAELYRAGALSETDRLDDAMRRTEHEAIRMGVLVDDLLHLARLDQGLPLRTDPVALGQIITDVVRDAAAVDPDREIVADIVTPAIVLGDDGRLRQVVSNLVTNARVHTEPDGPIRVLLRTESGRAVLEVADGGPGMPPDVAAKAFERFFRADPSRSRHRGGSGLGLSIVHATVTALGGSVQLETGPDRGTTVRITLPLAPLAPGPEAASALSVS
jgi:two-component system, OmpR family, sensor kinase